MLPRNMSVGLLTMATGLFRVERMNMTVVQPRRSRTADLVLRRATPDDADALFDSVRSARRRIPLPTLLPGDASLRRRPAPPHHRRRRVAGVGRIRRRPLCRRSAGGDVGPPAVWRSRRHDRRRLPGSRARRSPRPPSRGGAPAHQRVRVVLDPARQHVGGADGASVTACG